MPMISIVSVLCLSLSAQAFIATPKGKVRPGLSLSKECGRDGGIDRRTMIKIPLLSYLATSNPIPSWSKEGADAGTIAPVTQKVAMDVRISRADGTFYVRDDLPETPEFRVFYGRLVLGLFGTVAPNSVRQFLNYADVTYSPLEDNPLPSYSRSNFVSLDQSTGTLYPLKVFCSSKCQAPC